MYKFGLRVPSWSRVCGRGGGDPGESGEPGEDSSSVGSGSVAETSNAEDPTRQVQTTRAQTPIEMLVQMLFAPHAP